MVANSVMKKTSYGLGCTTIDRVTTEINPSQYAIEIKHLTLKDLEHTLFQMVEVDPH